MTTPKIAAQNLAAVAAQVDEQIALLRPLLVQLDAAEQAVRLALTTARQPLNDHLSGRARFSEMARSRLSFGTPHGLQSSNPPTLTSIINAAFARELA